MASEYSLLARDPIPIHVAGTRLLLPHRPAAVWAAGLDRVDRLAAYLADDDGRDLLVDLVMAHPQGVDDVKRESLRILGELTGRPWWESGRLISTSVTPDVLGRLVLAGVDPWARTVGEWCAATYALCVKGQDEKGRLRLDFSLSVPPPGYEDEWDDGGDDPEEVQAQLAKMKR